MQVKHTGHFIRKELVFLAAMLNQRNCIHVLGDQVGGAMVLMIVLFTRGFSVHWFCLVGGNELRFDLKAF